MVVHLYIKYWVYDYKFDYLAAKNMFEMIFWDCSHYKYDNKKCLSYEKIDLYYMI